jgi:hypothetical protein
LCSASLGANFERVYTSIIKSCKDAAIQAALQGDYRDIGGLGNTQVISFFRSCFFIFKTFLDELEARARRSYSGFRWTDSLRLGGQIPCQRWTDALFWVDKSLVYLTGLSTESGGASHLGGQMPCFGKEVEVKGGQIPCLAQKQALGSTLALDGQIPCLYNEQNKTNIYEKWINFLLVLSTDRRTITSLSIG